MNMFLVIDSKGWEFAWLSCTLWLNLWPTAIASIPFFEEKGKTIWTNVSYSLFVHNHNKKIL